MCHVIIITLVRPTYQVLNEYAQAIAKYKQRMAAAITRSLESSMLRSLLMCLVVSVH